MNKENFSVIAVGASAGGLSAFKTLVEAVPPSFEAALVLIQHLSPEHKSLLPELLQSQKPNLQIREVKDQTEIVPGVVYIKSPESDLIIKNGQFLPVPLLAEIPHHPIDRFLMSLAEEFSEMAIAVILSGTGTDGSRGVKAVRQQGGTVIAQSPETTEYPSMPQSVIESGMADQVLDTEEIIPAVLKGKKARGAEEVDFDALREPEHFDTLFRLIEDRTGYRLNYYKKNVVQRRVRRRLGLHGINDVQEYFSLLDQNSDELNALVQDFMIGVTSFFRDREIWEVFKTEVVQKLVSRKGQRPIRVWCPACSTGEEPYSVTMLLYDELKKKRKRCELQIFATDINESALERARAGRYPEGIASDVPKEYLNSYFTHIEAPVSFVVNKEIREKVVFATQNVLTDPPFSRMDLIICRNFLIYLEPDAQGRAVNIFGYSLKPEGYLFLGTAESISGRGGQFASISEKHNRIYQKIDTGQTSRMPVTTEFKPETVQRERSAPKVSSEKDTVAQSAHEVLLRRFTPASVVIDSHFEILHHTGPTNRYLRPRGAATHKLLEQLPENAEARMSGAVHRALMEKREVRLQASLEINEEKVQVSITVSPIGTQKELLLVVFDEKGWEASAAQPKPSEVESATVRMLENELRVTREENRRNTEQLRSLNEELKSSNEELQASNEEMETSREELQSLNEELVTLNNQLQAKVEEVEKVNSDLNNFISSTNIPTLFLDRQFNVRRYSPALKSIMRLIPADIGRSVTDLAFERLGEEMMEDAQKVLDDLVPVKKEVRVDDGCFIRNVQPYRTNDDRIDGVVIVFWDVSDLKTVQEKLRRAGEKLRIVADFTYDWEYWRGKDGKFLYVAPACQRVTGYTREEFMEDPDLYSRIVHPDDRKWVVKRLEKDLHERETHEFEFRIVRRDGEVRWIAHACRPVIDENGEYMGRRAANRDVTERKMAEQERERLLRDIAENEKRFRLVLENSQDGIHMTDLETNQYVFMSPSQEKLTGFKLEELNMSLEGAAKRLHPDDADRVDAYLENVVEGTEPQEPVEYRWKVKSGEYRWFSDSRRAVRDEKGNAVALIGVSRDITERKRSEKAIRESEAQFRQLADSMPQLVWMTRPDGYHEYFNERWYDFTGTVPGETAGEMWARLLHPDDYDRTLQIWHHSLKTGEPYNLEYRFRRASDGTYRWFIGRALPVRDEKGRITKWFGTCTEIQDLKEAQEALQRSEERFRTMADNISQLAWMADPKGWIFWYNKRWYDYTGTTLEQMQGWGWRKVHHPDHVTRVVKRIQHSWDTGELWEDTFPLRSTEGEYRWFLSRAVPIRDEKGNIVRWFGTNTDVTDQLEIEEKLRQRTGELADSNRELESFSYSVTHDLRSPLRTMRGFSEFLLEDYSDKLDSEGQDYLRRIMGGADKMDSIINDMLTLTRISRQEVVKQEMDLSDMAQFIVNEMRENEPDRQVNVFIQKGVTVKGDARLMNLAMTNLLGNAWKYTSKTENARIEFGKYEKNGEDGFFVKDNGVGFSMENAEKLFKPFQRLHSERDFSGTGIGLPIVDRVIRKHGGKIWAEGGEGKGAAFYFTL
ncbi:MAG: PAS domain S-box protein [Chitinispirillaceae bacterium]